MTPSDGPELPPPLRYGRNSGDEWVIGRTGERFWGRFGAAGLMAVDPARGVLLQHRVGWSHHGGTWALPGGARHEGESAVSAALREANEEAGVPAEGVRPWVTSVLDRGVWSYTTVVAAVTTPFRETISDPESLELAWVPLDEVTHRSLHPGFARSWPGLLALLDVRPVIVVDAANVVGAVPDGWWHDRAGAAARLLGRIAALGADGVPAPDLDLPGTAWFPDWVVVLEGRAVAAESPVVDALVHVEVVRARGAGDDRVVEEVVRRREADRPVIVVTSDRGLAARVRGVGASVRGAGWLLDRLGR